MSYVTMKGNQCQYITVQYCFERRAFAFRTDAAQLQWSLAIRMLRGIVGAIRTKDLTGP